MAKIAHQATEVPALFSDDFGIARFWRCETCGEPITPARSGIARWDAGDESTGTFDVVHHATECDDDTGKRWQPLDKFTESLLRNSVGGSQSRAALTREAPAERPYGIDLDDVLELSPHESEVIQAYGRLLPALDGALAGVAYRTMDEAAERARVACEAADLFTVLLEQSSQAAPLRREKVAAAAIVLRAFFLARGEDDAEYYLAELDHLPDGAHLRLLKARHDTELKNMW